MAKDSFPGFQVADDISNMYLESLKNQAGTLNAAWKKVLAGNYQFSDLLSDAAKNYQSHFDTAANVLSYRPNRSVGDEGPAWLHMELDTAVASPEVVANVMTRRFNSQQKLDKAWFGGAAPKGIDIDPSGFNGSYVNVALVSATPGAARDGATVAAAAKATKGRFLAMIFSKVELKEPPLVILSLNIV